MDTMRTYARDNQDGRAPLSNVEIDNVPRHQRTESALYSYHTTAKSGTWTQTNMAEHPAENDRFLRSASEFLLCSRNEAVLERRH